jgi:hypothetical protein
MVKNSIILFAFLFIFNSFIAHAANQDFSDQNFIDDYLPTNAEEPISKVSIGLAANFKIFLEISQKQMSILLNKLRKCSITYLILPNQEKDGNMSTLFDVWNTIQTQLFPSFEQELDPLTEKEQEFIQIVTFSICPTT